MDASPGRFLHRYFSRPRNLFIAGQKCPFVCFCSSGAQTPHLAHARQCCTTELSPDCKNDLPKSTSLGSVLYLTNDFVTQIL